jgi:hypothetical protein
MTPNAAWHDATLFDFQGKQVGRVRVPSTPFPPGVILWGKRYFILTLPDGAYTETKLFLVPLEAMYHTGTPRSRQHER